MVEKILVTGAFGQIGSELIPLLRKKHGPENVMAMGHITKIGKLHEDGPIVFGDVVHKKDMQKIVQKFEINTIFHLAAVISAKGEQNPQAAFDVNMIGTYNVLEVARENNVKKIIIPSSMAAFGPDTPRENTPNDTIQRPTTMYGVTKVAGELLGNYYFQKYDLDVRGVRFPGILSAETPPTAGTTDYATAIFYDGIKTGKYECFLRENTMLPMMYMPDALKALIDLSQAPLSKLKHHADYNVASMNFAPKDMEKELKKFIPKLQVTYKPDFRQKIADSWPRSLDDSQARKDWGWKPSYDLKAMVKDLYEKLFAKLAKTK